ncbi:ribosome biogenesis GTPase Der [Candidatus Gracilibacteria bacterium]|nr:ribosome biogenesis GTPase Der [Candidatus Gracilibacteria bacterium]
MLAKVTIIGRPNVGKSSFFNMYTGHKIAIVADEPGTTRDISEFEYKDEDNNLTYVLSDSGGLDFSSANEEIAKDIIERTARTIEESDLLIWLLEYDRFTELDERILKLLKEKKAKEVILVANKCDNENKTMESYSLAGTGGYKEFFPVSVSHNKGIYEVKRFVAEYLKEKGLNYLEEEVDESYIKLAIIGRPNVGKSSIINALVGKDRVMVKDMAGTTRDSIDTKFTYNEQNFILIDTAGIRRLSKVGTRNIENWSVMRTERAITRADIVVVVIDAFDGVVSQDLSIISRSLEENKGLVIVLNKWDMVLAKPGINKDTIMDKYLVYLKDKMDFLPWVSTIFTSATEKKRVNEILDSAIGISLERKKRVKTGIFNEFLTQVVLKHAPSGNKKSHNPKIYYGSQVDTNPPKFLVTVNNPDHFHFSYKRYIENRIRDTFGFFGTPIVLELKGRGKHKDKTK